MKQSPMESNSSFGFPLYTSLVHVFLGCDSDLDVFHRRQAGVDVLQSIAKNAQDSSGAMSGKR